MLAVTDQAVTAINGILASTEVPDDAGLRITAEASAPEEDTQRLEFRLAVVEAPEEDDQVLEDAAIFLEPTAAAQLDDKLLDAEIEGNQVRFGVTEQV